MKRTVLILFFVAAMSAIINAGLYLTLGYDQEMYGENKDFGIKSGRVAVPNGGLGWVWENGFSAGFAYNHLGIEDLDLSGHNMRIISPIPSVDLGYMVLFDEKKYMLWSTVSAGYGIARYRIDVNDEKGGGFEFAVKEAFLYQVKGQFYAGLEVGYRYYKAGFNYAPFDPGYIDLSGIFAGVQLTHVFE